MESFCCSGCATKKPGGVRRVFHRTSEKNQVEIQSQQRSLLHHHKVNAKTCGAVLAQPWQGRVADLVNRCTHIESFQCLRLGLLLFLVSTDSLPMYKLTLEKQTEEQPFVEAVAALPESCAAGANNIPYVYYALLYVPPARFTLYYNSSLFCGVAPIM